MSDPDLSSPSVRRRVYARALWVDDGWVREFALNNFHRVSSRAYRSGQPSPRHLRKRIPRHGIRTVVNLRGQEADNPMLLLEADTCARLGVRLEHVRTYSRSLPSRDLIHQLHELLRRIEYPAWFHCKSGADRAGLVATLYLHWIEGVPIQEIRQLRLWPYFHYRYAKTGLLDFFFERYLRDTADNPMSLLEWVDRMYDPQALKSEFRPVPWVDTLVDKLLRRE